MGPEKNIEYQFMENYQIKYEARHGPVPAYQFRENISLHSISLERVYCRVFNKFDIPIEIFIDQGTKFCGEFQKNIKSLYNFMRPY